MRRYFVKHARRPAEQETHIEAESMEDAVRLVAARTGKDRYVTFIRDESPRGSSWSPSIKLQDEIIQEAKR